MGRGRRIPPPTFDPLQRMGTALPIPPTTTPLTVLVWQYQTPLQNSAPSPLCPTTLPIKGRRGKGGGIPAMRRRAHKRGGGKRRRKMHFWKDVVGRQPTERAFPNRPTKDRKKWEGRKYKGASLRAPPFPYPKAVKYCPPPESASAALGSIFWGRLLGCAHSYIAPLVRAVPLFPAVSASIEAKGKGGARAGRGGR